MPRSPKPSWLLLLFVVVALWGIAAGQQLKEVPSYALKRGDKAPKLTFAQTVEGPNHIDWKSLRGKVVVLEFWGTWCGPCVADIPHHNELVAQYKGKPVQFIAVGHENRRKVEWFLQKHPIDGWLVLDTDLSMYKSYTAFGIPYAVIVDQKGSVAAVLSPRHLDQSVIDAVLTGKVPEYPAMGPEAYWDQTTAAEYFLKVGKEAPPTQK